jgi:hypothetical protein
MNSKALYPINELAMFPRYATRGAYQQATGQPPPLFDITKRPKFWEDPAAATSKSKNVFYERVIAVSDLGIAFPGDDGNPVLEPLMLTKIEAATVNIPPEGTNIEGAGVPECPMPLKPVPTGHELYFRYGGVVEVKNMAVFAEQVEGFTAADRALLCAIAAKLGV